MSGGDGSAPTQVERLRELIKNSHKLAPIAKLVDAYIESVDPGRVRIRYAVKPEFQLSISFLAPVLKGPVFGEGTVVKRGRTTFFMEAVVKDAEGVELARATSVGMAKRIKLA